MVYFWQVFQRVLKCETFSFIRRNFLFHAEKLSVSCVETFCFIRKNKMIQPNFGGKFLRMQFNFSKILLKVFNLAEKNVSYPKDKSRRSGQRACPCDRQGVASAIFRFLLRDLLSENPELGEITLNSSPYGKPFYLHLGFVPLSEEKELNGIKFTPMKYIL